VNGDGNNVTVVDGATNATADVSGRAPRSVAVNPITNKVYVSGGDAVGMVMVVDGATNETDTLPAARFSAAVAVNPVTNRVYVAGGGAFGIVTVIDGATNDVFSLEAGGGPCAVAVNPVTNRIYVANRTGKSVTVIDGVTYDTDTVSTDTGAFAVAVNPVTNKIYVAHFYVSDKDSSVTVIDGATNDTTRLVAGLYPCAVAVNAVTNKIYVANRGGGTVTVIDGATNATSTVPTGAWSCALAVNTIMNKVYVANRDGYSVTVIDGATNRTTMVDAGEPLAVAVNPVTGKAYVVQKSRGLKVITDAPTNDTRLHVEVSRLPGDTTSFARPNLTGKGVNRSTPGRTAMMGVGNRMNTSQAAWDWASITSGAGTDSVTWTYYWGADTLILGESFVCCVPLEDQAAITTNLGLGTPFAGNVEVYPIYRIGLAGGVEEPMSDERGMMIARPTVIRGVLNLQAAVYNLQSEIVLLSVDGRKAMNLRVGANDVRTIPPGVYFVRNCTDAKVIKILLVD
jgi:YVTN family beta-propeller protein